MRGVGVLDGVIRTVYDRGSYTNRRKEILESIKARLG
tara:strand:+ start:146 stop:256 length:111 start_codon:yes stop_codon:yes gene_type:complete